MTNGIKEALRQSYNNFAHEREKNEQQEWKIKTRDSFLKFLINEGKESLLDIGAGVGRDSKFFKDNYINVTAVDLSDEMVKLCHEKGIEHFGPGAG
jgi:cyclopropane fatty-acyl-phospholipid synthase-like methyltransferase